METVLLTGASGFLGQHLLRELLGAGVTVRALSRRAESDVVLAGLGAEPVRGDITDAGSLRMALRGVHSVFHAAADTNAWRRNNAAQTRTNVEGGATLLAAARDASVAAFVHTSSVSAYSHLAQGVLREDVLQRGGESWINYERNKFAVERAVRTSGLPFLIFQPSHVLGPGDTRNWSRLIGLVDRGELPGVPPGSGAFADVREIARAQVRGWQAGRFGETYLLGGEHASFLDLITRIGAKLGRPTPRRAMPALVLKGYARLVYAASLVTGKMPEITPEAAQFTCHHLQVDSGKAMAELNYRQTDLDSLLDDTIAWLRGQRLIA